MISTQNLNSSTPPKSHKLTRNGVEDYLRFVLQRSPTAREVEASQRIIEMLPKNQEEKFESLMLTPGNQEIELYERLLGKNTLQAARIIADEYICRFGEQEEIAKELLQAMIPKGRASSWDDLDLHITSLCKPFTETLESFINKVKRLHFFDSIRYLLRELPQRKDYRPENEKYHFTTCSFCWRSAPRSSTHNRRPLCDVHNIDSTNSEYRRRKRLAKRIHDIWSNILNTVPSLRWVRENTSINPQDFYLDMCRYKGGYLPYLSDYLHSLLLPLNCPKDVILALEHGVYLSKMSPAKRHAWDRHIDFLANNLYWKYHGTIFIAEAWLQADAECKPRGKRRNL